MKFKHVLLALLLIFLSNVSIFSQFSQIGPYGGYIRCLIKDNQGRIISGNAYGGIFRTSDSGQNWEQIFTGYRNEDVRSLAVNSSGHIFAGTNGHGLYRSTDDGVTWVRLFNLVYDRTVEEILIKTNGDIFLATFDGVYHSTDNGDIFILTNNGIPTSTIYSLGMFGNYIYAGTGGNGIYRTSDDGTNWEEANNGVMFSGRNVLDFSSPEFSENIKTANIYATLSDKIVRSTDGINWDELPTPAGNYLHLLNRNNDDIVAAGSSLISSNNQGNNWNVSMVQTNARLSTIIEIDNNTLMTGSEGPGNFVSTDNMANWNIEVKGMPATAVTGISWTAGAVYVSTRHSGLFKTTDGAQSWSNISSSIPHGWFYDICWNPVTNSLFALHQTGSYRSTNGGNSWSGPYSFGNTMNINSLGNVFIASGSYIYKSIDDGVTYQPKLVDNNVTYIRQVAINQNNVMVIATANESGFGGQGTWCSTDIAETWFPATTGSQNNITSVESLDLTGIPPNDCSKNFVAGSADGKYFSMNDDYSWNQFNVGFQQNSLVKDIASVNYTEGFDIALISEAELYKLDPGVNCLFFKDPDVENDITLEGFAGLPLQFENLNSEYTYLIGTIGTGILKKVISTDVKNKTNNSPSNFELFQNYPNPFNPSTKIKFSIPQNGRRETQDVTLKVFDVLGNEVATLVNEEKPAGNYEVDFNSAGLSSGIYFYKLQAGTFTETKKMLLMK